MMIGNNVALVIYGIVMARILEPYILQYLPDSLKEGITVILIQTFLSTMLILVTGEFIPKVLFRVNPNKILIFFAVPVLIIYILLYPVVFIIIGLAELLLNKLSGIRFSENIVAFGKIDLDHYIRDIAARGQTNGNEVSNEIRIFQKALDFTSVKVRECMIPRTEIIALGVEAPIESLRKTFSRTGLSKILIYEGSIDHIIGFTHSYEMFRHPTTIRSILLPIAIVPETMAANELLTQFTKQHKTIALVVDEFGSTSGIVTMEDVIEEIFGEIEDEHDTEDLMEKQVSENEFLFSGRVEIDYINHKYQINLPLSTDYETLGGLIFYHHRHIPIKNEVISIPPFEFTVLEVLETRIERVKLVKKEE